MYSKMEQQRAAGNTEAALNLAQGLTSRYGGTPEADRAALEIPALERAIEENGRAARSRAAEAESEKAKRELAAKWTYSLEHDPMTSRMAKYARIESENLVALEFPYQGPQRGRLVFRNHPTHGRDILFQIERGQLLCQPYSDCRIMVRFDEAPAQSWSVVAPSDHSSTTLFLQDESTFMRRMRGTNVLRLMVPVYQAGEQVFEFHVGGFDEARYKARVRYMEN